jgi:hypothetical protein
VTSTSPTSMTKSSTTSRPEARGAHHYGASSGANIT